MATFSLTNKGNKVKVVIDNGVTVLYPDKKNINLKYRTSDNTISIDFTMLTNMYSYPDNPAANITIAGVAITNQATFEAQLDLLFVTQGSGANVDTAALVTLAASGTSGTSADQTNTNGRGLQLVLDITAITGTTPSITVIIQGKDAASGKYYNLLTSAAISTVSTNLLTVYPGGLTTANVASPTVLPRVWRVSYTIAGVSPAVTATIGASVIG